MDTFKEATEEINKVEQLMKINLRLEAMEFLRLYIKRINNSQQKGDPTSLDELVNKHVENTLAILNAPFDVESAYNPLHGEENGS